MKLHCTSAKAILIAVVAAVVLGTAFGVSAADKTWDGGASGTNTSWSTASSWDSDALPASGDNLLFANGGTPDAPAAIGLGANFTVGKLRFDVKLPSALSVQANPSATNTRTLTINGSGGTLIEKTANDTGTITFVTASSGTAPGLFNITLAGSGNISVANASDTINLAPVISQTGGTRSITKIGNGTLILSGANSFSGGLTVSGGIVRLNDNAGAGTGTLTLNGGALRNGGSPRTIANPIKLEASTVNAIYAIGTTSTVFLFTGALSGSGTLDNTLAVPAETDIAGSTQQIRMQGSLSNFEGTIKINRVTNADQFHFYAVNAGADDGSKAKFVFDGATGPVAADLPAIAIGRNDNATFKMGALSGNGGRIEDGLSTLGTQMTLEVGHLGTSTQWDGVFANQTGNTANFTKVGGGTLTLGGNNTYNGVTTVSGGTLQTNGGNAIPNGAGAGNVTVAVSAKLSIGDNETINGLSGVAGSTVSNANVAARTLSVGDNDQTSTFAGLIENGTGMGALSLTKIGAGVLTLSGNNTYTGNTAINAGTLTLTNASGSGTGTGNITIGSGTTAATLNVGNGGAGGSVAGNIAFANTSGSSIVNFNRTADLVYNGNITGANGAVNKLNSNKLTLGGTSTYGGVTTVSAGTLLVNGSVSGAASVTGGRLGGSGTIGGNVTVTGGTLAPGASIDTLYEGGDLSMSSSSFEWEFNGGSPSPMGATADVMNVGGDLIILSSVTLTGFNLSTTVGMAVVTGTKFVAISYDGAWNNGLFIDTSSNVVNDDSYVFVDGKRFKINYNDTAFSDAVNFGEVPLGYANAVTLTAVPEATSILVMGLGGVFAIGAVWLGKRCGLAAFRIS